MFAFNDRVRFTWTDENSRMTIPAIIDVMQDCSDQQSESLGMGHKFMQERHRAWLLRFWQIYIDRYPMEHDTYRVETRAWRFQRFYGDRNFAMYDAEGAPYVRANSVWFYVDAERMRPMVPDAVDREPYGLDEPLDMEYAKAPKVRLAEGMEERESFPVLRSHLDLNHHVNNGKYIMMACEYFPEDWDIAEIRTEYILAAKYGDRIYPKVGYSSPDCMIVALCQEDGNPYAVVSARRREEAME